VCALWVSTSRKNTRTECFFVFSAVRFCHSPTSPSCLSLFSLFFSLLCYTGGVGKSHIMNRKPFYLAIFSIFVVFFSFFFFFSFTHASDWTYFNNDRIIYHLQHLGSNGHLSNWIEYPTYTYIYLQHNSTPNIGFNLLFPHTLDYSGKASVTYAISAQIMPVTVSATTNCRFGFNVAYRANFTTFPSFTINNDYNFTTASTSYTTVYIKKTRTSNLTNKQHRDERKNKGEKEKNIA